MTFSTVLRIFVIFMIFLPTFMTTSIIYTKLSTNLITFLILLLMIIFTRFLKFFNNFMPIFTIFSIFFTISWQFLQYLHKFLWNFWLHKNFNKVNVWTFLVIWNFPFQKAIQGHSISWPNNFSDPSHNASPCKKKKKSKHVYPIT